MRESRDWVTTAELCELFGFPVCSILSNISFLATVYDKIGSRYVYFLPFFRELRDYMFSVGVRPTNSSVMECAKVVKLRPKWFSMDKPKRDWLSHREWAKLLGFAPASLRSEILLGKLKAEVVKFGYDHASMYLVSRYDAAEWVETRVLTELTRPEFVRGKHLRGIDQAILMACL